MKAIFHTILFIFLGGYMPLLHGQSDMLQREIGEIIRYEAEIDFDLVPGVLVGIMDGDSTYVCSFGERMDPDSIYELGSLTKPVVAWLAWQALDSLGWTSEVSICQFLPDSLCTEGWKSLNVDQVLAHRTGLPRMPGGLDESKASIQDPYPLFDVSHLAADISKLVPVPGHYSYSHVAYGLLYWLFERVGGIGPFSQSRLMTPFELDKTGYSFPDQMIAAGHGFDGRSQPPWHFDAMAIPMGLKSSLNDLMVILKVISPKLISDTPLLTPSLKKELKSLDKASEYKVIDGWFLIQSGNELIYYHTGRTGGHQVSIAFMPEKRKGVVVISNGALGSNELSLLVLNMINRAK